MRTRPRSRQGTGPGRKRVCFVFNAQLHHVLHGVGTAAALAKLDGFEVEICVPSHAHVEFVQAMLPTHGPRPAVSLLGSRMLRYLSRIFGTAVPPKLLTLLAARRRLARLDAIVIPERTTLFLKRIGVTAPQFIHIDHGAGDRAAGFDARIRQFDFVLLAGDKQRRRMLQEGLIRPGNHAIVGYPKFDVCCGPRDPAWTPFADDKPIILYNPHFSKRLGSWSGFGVEVVRRIAETERYNLIIAPHIRLFDSRMARRRAASALAPFTGRKDIHVDLGGVRLVDMSYTNLADIYLGDVSSQVYEFLRDPRPCVFLNGHGAQWRDDENYRHWHYGPVVETLDALVPALDTANTDHKRYRTEQEIGFRSTFDLRDQTSSKRAAAAISAFLCGGSGRTEGIGDLPCEAPVVMLDDRNA